MRIGGRVLRHACSALVALALVVGACAPAEEEASSGGAEIPDEIVIGATLPLTGDEADVGGYFKEGYELAFKEIEQQGGIGRVVQQPQRYRDLLV